LAALDQKIPYDWIKYAEFPTLKSDSQKKFLASLSKLKQGEYPPFFVIDGNFTTKIQEIASLARQLKPDAVFVDGAYLVQSDHGYSKHERIGYVCNALKRDVATKLDIPVTASWQFSRESTKVKKGDKIGTEHIGDSDEIGRASSAVLGLFQEESAATIKQRKVRFVKGRAGEVGEFTINWDFQNMDFSEVENIKDHEIMIS